MCGVWSPGRVDRLQTVINNSIEPIRYHTVISIFNLHAPHGARPHPAPVLASVFRSDVIEATAPHAHALAMSQNGCGYIGHFHHGYDATLSLRNHSDGTRSGSEYSRAIAMCSSAARRCPCEASAGVAQNGKASNTARGRRPRSDASEAPTYYTVGQG